MRRKLQQWVHGIAGIICCAVVLAWPGTLFCADKAGALIEKILFERETSTRERIIFKLNGPYIPKIFATKGETPKVVFDFYDTRHSPAIQSIMKSGGNLVSAIRVGVHTDPQLKTRVVLDLVPSGDYDFAQDFRVEDNSLIITVFHAVQKDKKQAVAALGSGKTDKTPSVPAKAAPTSGTEKKVAGSGPTVQGKMPDLTLDKGGTVAGAKKPEAPSSQLMIKKISYEQGAEKGEKVVFQLNNFHPPVIFGIEEGTPSVVCDFLDAGLGPDVPVDIAVQGQSVQQIRVENNKKSHKVRVVLELVPNRHYDLQQIYFKEENLYVLVVKSADTAATKVGGRP